MAFVISKYVSPKTHPSRTTLEVFFREKFINFTGTSDRIGPNLACHRSI